MARGKRAGENRIMHSFAYSNSPYSIRRDLPEAFRYTWDKLARPGTWFSGADRIAIAGEVRAAEHCELCHQRKQALSPFGVQGEHTSSSDLPVTVIDVAHRLTTDASRLTRTWLDECVAKSLSLEAYVEILSIVVGVLSIDTFHKALGFPLEPLPAPIEGEPNHDRRTARRTGS